MAMLLMAGFGLVWLVPATAYACSPPFEEPTIRALGPQQVVVVGTIGERVAGGRAFHVQQWFNGRAPRTPILIAFKEGEPVGDCSYLITTGAALIIAPYQEADGRLSADLVTLQADPSTELGRKYVAEAIALFGPGVVPPTAPEAPPSGPTPDVSVLVAALGIAVTLVFAGVVLFARWQRQRS
jgi:hypothetical protein